MADTIGYLFSHRLSALHLRHLSPDSSTHQQHKRLDSRAPIFR
jgi:hypothetical protein